MEYDKYQEAGNIPSEQELHRSHQALLYVVISWSDYVIPASVFILKLRFFRLYICPNTQK